MKRRLLRAGLPLLALLAIAPLGFGRGGGGGSGGGGAGGGTSGGGSSSSSYSGSSRSYSGSSSSSYWGNSSYGGSSYYGGSDDQIPSMLFDWRVDLFIFGVVVVALVFLKLRDAFVPVRPYRLGNWGLLLKNADRYTRTFERIARDRQFRTATDRQEAMTEIVNSIDPSDLVDAFFSEHGQYVNGTLLGPPAESLYNMLCKQAEIDKGVEHLQLPGKSIHQDDLANERHPASSDSMCLFGLLLVSNRLVSPSDQVTPQSVLQSMKRSSPIHGPLSYLFYYYSPRPGESMSPQEARRLFGKLAQRGEVGT